MTERTARTAFPCEFHIAKSVRNKYDFQKSLYRSNGNVIFADFRAVREFARKMNDQRPPGAKPVRAGDLNAMGLIDEFMHLVFRAYESSSNPGFLRHSILKLESSMGIARLRSTLHTFTELFPPALVFTGEKSVAEYLSGATDGRPNPEVTLEEMLMLHLANVNPAFGPFIELFDAQELSAASSYEGTMTGLKTLLRGAPPMREGDTGGSVSILDILEAPMKAHPHSLAAQMQFIRERWVDYLPDGSGRRILSAEDLAKEDNKQFETGSAGPVVLPDYSMVGRGTPVGYPETENFTHDTEWMPNVVLLAKNTYVWLDQLSKRHGRKISRLDEVPDEELDRIAGWNFTSLWLIGIWSRSAASEKIKRMSGNPEAAPSAYSVFEYEIASDLGGEGAFSDLSHRAWQRGIRLAADMVPNHTGLTSRWIKEHPDYFIQSDQAPFPAYRFTGDNLSDDADYQVRIEDGYWSKTDAAVVFQHTDNRNGRTRYVYHGNDGTNMPWNDTAQLDFLKTEVREAVIDQILHVARKFSVIRFDAAMTLAKKHFHRLWYPQPGTGGDIPSRSDHGMWQEDFDAVFPGEFWREVVDRINSEMPQTLLLAEAFWLLEGYFVRTLGMHRVYNSAFMHILLKEDNAMYREAIRSTLHFDPEILKRYVNFMSNPDEKTVVDQFGKGDKYFGIATLMVTLPGLPMFAHGQIEGFGEKYGMEYRKAYHDEMPDADLVRRHESDIIPLLKLRHLFSQTAEFELYDVIDGHGLIIEDVFAYSNMAGDERAIILYNNRYESYTGRIHVSAGKLPAAGGDGVLYRSLGEALKMNRAADVYYIFKEHRSGLEFIRPGTEFMNDGMAVQLGAFQSQVFLNFREVHDADGTRGRLCRELEGRGVQDIEKAARAIALRPFHEALGRLLESGLTASVVDDLMPNPDRKSAGLKEFKKRFAAASALLNKTMPVPVVMMKEREAKIASWLKKLSTILSEPEVHATSDTGVVLGWVTVSALMWNGVANVPRADARYRELLLDLALEELYTKSITGGGGGRRKALLVECLVTSGGLLMNETPRSAFREIFAGAATREFIGVNTYEGVEYFNQESLTELAGYWALQMRFAMSAEKTGKKKPGTRAAANATVSAATVRSRTPAIKPGEMIERLIKAAASVGYKLSELIAYLDSDEFTTLQTVPDPAASLTAGKPGTSKKRGTPKKKI